MQSPQLFLEFWEVWKPWMLSNAGTYSIFRRLDFGFTWCGWVMSFPLLYILYRSH
ncbi:uncharacterized protein BDZ99DRAFT_468318 [Mytilinidion resinicola]|uniref:Uncharacterized protein n=1 Tax=Mytilinidion resinicola TaxID=574789 RepID=A0A6A6Y6C7_9PEZI|nr:uncharacterized protein BDZ99DRAFT_468318 [Mytilinidion resinicola]KAF2803357.1 hypothetical protein BDZ99DRAFT_468318 [Mytilinidion resinicola]